MLSVLLGTEVQFVETLVDGRFQGTVESTDGQLLKLRSHDFAGKVGSRVEGFGGVK